MKIKSHLLSFFYFPSFPLFCTNRRFVSLTINNTLRNYCVTQSFTMLNNLHVIMALPLNTCGKRTFAKKIVSLRFSKKEEITSTLFTSFQRLNLLSPMSHCTIKRPIAPTSEQTPASVFTITFTLFTKFLDYAIQQTSFSPYKPICRVCTIPLQELPSTR